MSEPTETHRHTKTEAIDLMKQGVKMRHRYFSDNEWVVIEDGKMLFEDGVRCTQQMFWFDRMQDSWQTGWAKFEEWNR